MTDNAASIVKGYCCKLARVNLTEAKVTVQDIQPDLLAQWIGGVGLGTYYLAKEVPPQCDPLADENKVLLFSGPLAGSSFPGSGTFCCVTKSPITGFTAAGQANGYFGAYLKMSGFDGIIIEGTSAQPAYLSISEGGVEILSAAEYWGLGTFATEKAILEKHQVKPNEASVYSIGPAGENLVRFSTFMGDQGHAIGHGGVGAVLGAKKLKAVLAFKKKTAVLPARKEEFDAAVKECRTKARGYLQGRLASHGTAGLVLPAYQNGELPIRNLQTNVQEGIEKIDGTYFREHFESRPKTCHMCPIAHNAWVKIKEGPYAGLEAEEPEYENISTLGSNLGIMRADALIYLSYLADDLGVNTTESGWVLSWLMECSEKKLLGEYQADYNLPWGDVNGVEEMLKNIAYRRGKLGNLVAEGVWRASNAIGGEAATIAVCTKKGGSPRGHDHRARWTELIDTCVSNTGTIESTFGRRFPAAMGAPLQDGFDAEAVAMNNARINGWRQFEDAIGTCRFCTGDAPEKTMEAVSALTGLELDIPAAARIGRRIVTLLRAYNCKAGLTVEMEEPSERYGSTPVDGPAQGKAIMPHWEKLRSIYYQNMGWDPRTGVPTPETMKEMGLPEFI